MINMCVVARIPWCAPCEMHDGSTAKQSIKTLHRGWPVGVSEAERQTQVQAAPAVMTRPRAEGKFLVADGRKLLVRGVTYGTFRPGPDGHEFPPAEAVARDFALIAQHGLNAVRTYTAPPRWLLDLAQAHGLRVLVGLA